MRAAACIQTTATESSGPRSRKRHPRVSVALPRCPSCGSLKHKIEKVLSAPEGDFWTKYRRCAHCGLKFVTEEF